MVGTQHPLIIGERALSDVDGPGQIGGDPQLPYRPCPHSKRSDRDVGVGLGLDGLPQRLDLGHQVSAEVSPGPGV